MDKPSAKASYRPDVDGLRAVAILSVVAYHVGIPGISGGFAGVDVFFVISGYLITQVLYREIAESGSISILNFYSRRVRRILPSLTLVTLCTLLAGAVLLPPFQERAALDRSAISAMAFVSNEFFRIHSGGYFDQPAERMPLLHLWSLSVEEQFYLMWPWLMVGAAAVAPSARRAILTLAISVISAGSLAVSMWFTRSSPIFAFYSATSRVWELGAGALLALLASDVRTFARRSGGSIALGGAVLVATAFSMFGPATPFPGLAALLPVAGAVLIIHGNTLAPDMPVSRLLSTNVMTGIGKLSYSWYLWHWPILSLARDRRLGDVNLGVDVALALVALVLAGLTLVHVENPARFGPTLRELPARGVVGAGLTTLAALSLIAAGLGVWDKVTPKPEMARVARAIVADRSPRRAACDLWPGWSGVLPIRDCTFGPGREPTLVIWGDSHADAWSPMLEGFAAQNHHTYLEVSMNSCPPLIGKTPRINLHGTPFRECTAFNNSVMDFLRKGAAVKGVVLAARWPSYSGSPSIARHDSTIHYFDSADRSTEEALASLESGLVSTLSALDQAGLRALILLAPPEFPYFPHQCVQVRPVGECGIARATYEDHRRRVNAVIERVAERFPDARVADPADFMCDRRYCPALLTEGIPSLYDDDHISASAARRYASVIAAEMRWLSKQN